MTNNDKYMRNIKNLGNVRNVLKMKYEKLRIFDIMENNARQLYSRNGEILANFNIMESRYIKILI